MEIGFKFEVEFSETQKAWFIEPTEEWEKMKGKKCQRNGKKEHNKAEQRPLNAP